MKVLNDVSLAKKTTFKVGGKAVNYYIPENTDDVRRLISDLKDREYYILSGGSNLLINDKRSYEHIIFCGEFDREMTHLGDGRFYIGASNRIQRVISFVNENGFGGFEELICLPAMFGGNIYMNAGIGGKNKEKFNIGDFIIKVKCMDRSNGDIVWISKEDCKFGYRYSIFKENNYIILGAEIQLSPQSPDVSKNNIAKRREFCKSHQEWGKGCFGSCFSTKNWKILNMTRKLSKFKGGVYQSHLNSNWLVNDGSGTFDDAMKIIDRITFLHKLFHASIEPEVIIWK